LEDLGVDERIILNCISKRKNEMVWTEFKGLKTGTGEDLVTRK
jgi:hypothetical protein